jgi:hypothetical protein
MSRRNHRRAIHRRHRRACRHLRRLARPAPLGISALYEVFASMNTAFLVSALLKSVRRARRKGLL